MLISLLQLFGITPDRYPFLVLAILIVFCAAVIYIRVNKINNTLNKVKLNIKAIVTFLSTDRPNFDIAIIEAMSPLRIKEKGYEILEESGFRRIMSDSEKRAKILSCIADQDPTTKLDVEKTAIVFFATLLENEFMNPIKSYLYEHPDNREVFPTLAGLYIRDEYLKDHLEITR